MFSLKDWLLSVAMEGEKRVRFGTKEGTLLLNVKASLHQTLVSDSLLYSLEYH